MNIWIKFTKGGNLLQVGYDTRFALKVLLDTSFWARSMNGYIEYICEKTI